MHPLVCFLLLCFVSFVFWGFFAKGQLEGYSDYGSAVFKAGCYLMDLHQSVTADPGKAEPHAGCPPNGDQSELKPLMEIFTG